MKCSGLTVPHGRICDDWYEHTNNLFEKSFQNTMTVEWTNFSDTCILMRTIDSPDYFCSNVKPYCLNGVWYDADEQCVSIKDLPSEMMMSPALIYNRALANGNIDFTDGNEPANVKIVMSVMPEETYNDLFQKRNVRFFKRI